MEKSSEKRLAMITLNIMFIAVIIFAIIAYFDFEASRKAKKEAEKNKEIVDILQIDNSYSLNKYDLLEKSDMIVNSDNLVVRIPGEYMISIPDTLENYIGIVLPETLAYPNISASNTLDNDGRLYFDPGEFTTFTKRTAYDEIAMTVIAANTKDDLQTLEQCNINYIDFFIRKEGTKIELPEIGLKITKETNINDPFFKDASVVFETSGLDIIQYRFKNGGVLFMFDKLTGDFNTMRVFTNKQLDGYEYHKVFYQG